MSDRYDDEDAEYEPFPEERRSKTGQRLASLLAVLVVLAAFGAVAIYLGYVRQVDPGGAPGAEVKVLIPRGTSTQGIGEILDREGIITSAQVWRIFTRIEGAGAFQAGEYTFRRRSSMDEAVAVLRRGPQIKYERLTVPEGLTIGQIADRVGTLQGRSRDAFLAAAESGQVRSKYQPQVVRTLEGLLLPETYNVEPKDDEEAILRRMVQSLDGEADRLGYQDAQARVGITPYEAIIVASLVERETRIDDERGKVAQVIYNRLRRGMLLQIDATVVYALGRSGTDTRVLLKDLEINSPYNTYKNKGLPPTPIAAPGAASLRAALEPEPGPWLYYVVTEKDGRHSFAVTGAEHQANIRKAEANGVR